MTKLRTLDNKRSTDSSNKNYYVKSVDIIKDSQKVYDISYAQIKHFSNTILNLLSLPIRCLVDRVIGHVLAQATPISSDDQRGRQGEGRGRTDPTLSLINPLTKCASFFQNPCFISFKATKVSLLRSVRKSGVTYLSGVQL